MPEESMFYLVLIKKEFYTMTSLNFKPITPHKCITEELYFACNITDLTKLSNCHTYVQPIS